MSASELYDFLSTITPDYSATSLTIKPHGIVQTETQKNHVIHYGADGSEERISIGTGSIFYLTVTWNTLSESDSGTIFDFYNDAAKANGCQRSFKFNYGDGHTYVVRFDCALPREGQSPSRYGLPSVRMKVLGRIVDT